MTNKELRRLGRKDLLELLIDQEKKNASLRKRVEELEKELDDKRIAVSKSGSMAEAAVLLNGLLTDADKAVEQYKENIRQNESESRKLLEDAKKQAEDIIREAEKTRDEKLREADKHLQTVKNGIAMFLADHPEIKIKNKE